LLSPPPLCLALFSIMERSGGSLSFTFSIFLPSFIFFQRLVVSPNVLIVSRDFPRLFLSPTDPCFYESSPSQYFPAGPLKPHWLTLFFFVFVVRFLVFCILRFYFGPGPPLPSPLRVSPLSVFSAPLALLCLLASAKLRLRMACVIWFFNGTQRCSCLFNFSPSDPYEAIGIDVATFLPSFFYSPF